MFALGNHYADPAALRIDQKWARIFDASTSEADEDLLHSIEKLGVYVALSIAPDGTVLDGSRRLQAVQRLIREELWTHAGVPVVVVAR